MSTHLVETSEEDSFTAVSRHISELLNKGQASDRHWQHYSSAAQQSPVCPAHSCSMHQHTAKLFDATFCCLRVHNPSRVAPLLRRNITAPGHMHWLLTMANAAQIHTELADSPGLRFRDECLTLVAEARYGELLERWLGQFEMLLSKAQDKGAIRSLGCAFCESLRGLWCERGSVSALQLDSTVHLVLICKLTMRTKQPHIAAPEAYQAIDLVDFTCRVSLSVDSSCGHGADLDCCINVTCHLVSRVPPPQLPAAAQQVTAAVTAKVRACLSAYLRAASWSLSSKGR